MYERFGGQFPNLRFPTCYAGKGIASLRGGKIGAQWASRGFYQVLKA